MASDGVHRRLAEALKACLTRLLETGDACDATEDDRFGEAPCGECEGCLNRQAMNAGDRALAAYEALRTCRWPTVYAGEERTMSNDAVKRWRELPAFRKETACFVLFARAEEAREHLKSLQARGLAGTMLFQAAEMMLADIEAGLDVLREVADG